MHRRSLSLRLLSEAYAICRLPAGAPLPAWSTEGTLFSVTRTPTELSILCEERCIPADVAAHVKRGWRAVEIVGPFAFEEAGVLASVVSPLAHAEIPVLAIATYDTDLLLIQGDELMRASAVLRGVGHVVADAD